jgi:hypothetical protein
VAHDRRGEDTHIRETAALAIADLNLIEDCLQLRLARLDVPGIQLFAYEAGNLSRSAGGKPNFPFGRCRY